MRRTKRLSASEITLSTASSAVVCVSFHRPVIFTIFVSMFSRRLFLLYSHRSLCLPGMFVNRYGRLLFVSCLHGPYVWYICWHVWPSSVSLLSSLFIIDLCLVYLWADGLHLFASCLHRLLYLEYIFDKFGCRPCVTCLSSFITPTAFVKTFDV